MAEKKGIQKGIAGKRLLDFIGRIERINGEIEQSQEDRKVVFAEAKAEGFDTKTVRRIIKLRKLDKAERDEAEALLDTYMHAIGMAEPPELFRAVGLLSVDYAARDSIVSVLGQLVPDTGELIIKTGGVSIRLFRDEDGMPQAEDYIPAPPPEPKRRTVYDDGLGYTVVEGEADESTGDDAMKLGKRAGRKRSTERNPYKTGDPRRKQWDDGYRAGMAETDKKADA